MSAESVTLTPTYAPAENAPEVTVFSVPVPAFPTSYDYGMQWSVGLMIAGMMKRAKYDIRMGNENGYDTVLVLTGISKREDIERLGIKPTYVVNTLKELL